MKVRFTRRIQYVDGRVTFNVARGVVGTLIRRGFSGAFVKMEDGLEVYAFKSEYVLEG